MPLRQLFVFIVLFVWYGISATGFAGDAVLDDWKFQENRKNRTIADVEAVLDLQQRYRLLCENLKVELPFEPLSRESLKSLFPAQREKLYCKFRQQLRETAFENPLVKDRPLVFMKRKRFVCQMMHEYVGYYYAYPGITGGEICILPQPGKSFDFKSLTAERFPEGVFETLSLSYDGKTIYFAFAEIQLSKDGPRDVKWSQLGHHGFQDKTFEYFASRENKFQIYSMNVDGTNLKQLTNDIYDNFDPVPLPDGGIAFLSTRRGGFVRCNNPWEPVPVYTLHRMDADGKNLRTLSVHETNEWHPSVLNDGRIVYSRWDYVDRSAAHYHGLWTCMPDGTLPSILFGNYTQMVSACYQPRAVPGSNKIMFLAGAHHANTGGSIVLVDPNQTAYKDGSAEDSLDSLERITPEVDFPETPNQWPDTYYHSPWPLSEDYYFVSYSREPLGCMGAGSDETGRTGLYYLDRFGNLELLYEDEEISCQYPIPLEARATPPAIPDSRDETLGETGEFYLENVYKSHVPLPEDRRVQELRIFQILPKGPGWISHTPSLGHAYAEGGRMLLGTVPVNESGTAYFTAPTGKALYFQAVDEQGKAVQTMRSSVYLQPGERRGCVGCHEPLHSSPENLPRQIVPDAIKPGPEAARPFHFARLVQPILDKRCVSCHEESNKIDLRGTPTKRFSVSYENLRPFVRWYEWGGSSIQQTVTLPGKCGADMSPLTKILEDENHRSLDWSDEEKRTVYLWLDSNVPFYGVFEPEEQRRQQMGKAVGVPKLQ